MIIVTDGASLICYVPLEASKRELNHLGSCPFVCLPVCPPVLGILLNVWAPYKLQVIAQHKR